MANYTYRFRLYPTKEQIGFLNQETGNCRFVYNTLLSIAIKEYQDKKTPFNYYKIKKLLPLLKEQHPFLKLSNSQSLQESVKSLDKAFKNLFQKRSSFPRFKKRKSTNAVSIPQFFKIEEDKLYIPKLKTPIKIRLHRKIEGKIRSITIVKKPSGRFYINVLVEKEIQRLPKQDKAIAIDMGIEHFATLSTGEKIDNKRYLVKAEKRLKRLSRQLSKKEKRSNNFHKLSIRISKLYERVVNKRDNFLHKLSKGIIDDVIILEDLNIKGMHKSKYLSKSISDVSWGRFINFLEYKSKWYGREIVKINRYFPSSKTCSRCGYINKELTLSERGWVCPICHTIHDRDINAAINLLRVGLEQSEFTPVEYALVDDRSESYLKSHRMMKQEALHLNEG